VQINKADSVKVKTAQLAPPPPAQSHANSVQFPIRTVGFRTTLNLFTQQRVRAFLRGLAKIESKFTDFDQNYMFVY
jgi:hypothetical protein